MRIGSSDIRRILAIILAAGMVVLAGCAPSSTPGGTTTASDETLRIAAFQYPAITFNPYDVQGRPRAQLENVYESLVLPDKGTFEIKGALAESWSPSADGKTWRFNLRKGVTFHDGTAFDAKSVKDSYDLLKKINKSEFAPFLSVIKDIKVVDANTVEFNIDATGFPFLPRLTGLSIASSKAVKDHGDDLTWWASNAVGTGPYKLEEFISRERLTLVRNDKWWGPKPYFAKVIIIAVPEASAQALMLQKGDVDIAYFLPLESLSAMKADKNLQVLDVKGDRVMNVRMNLLRPPLNNKLLRQALAYAFDYSANQVARQDVAPPDGPVPAQYMNGWTPSNLITKQDLDKAKSLLAQAGYKPGELTLSIGWFETGKQQTLVELMQSSFAKIGVNVKLNQVDVATVFQQLNRFKADPKANATAADGIDMIPFIRGPFVPHVQSYFSSFDPAQFYNCYGYSNPTADKLFEQGHRAANATDALNFYKQGVESIVADQPDIWPYVERRVVGMRADLQGYYMSMFFPESHVWTISRKK